jgi:hypothetical protein
VSPPGSYTTSLAVSITSDRPVVTKVLFAFRAYHHAKENFPCTSPVLSIIALGSFVTRNGTESLHAILAGSLVMSLMFSNLNNVSSQFAYMRFSGTLDYYATFVNEQKIWSDSQISGAISQCASSQAFWLLIT